jgi:hypothetical protein
MSIAVTPTQFVPPDNTTKVNQKPAEQKTATTAVDDTVHLSAPAQAALSAGQAALQEATETQAQTSKEARTGDSQAARLLAKETAH